MYIYKTTNLINNMIYVGQTSKRNNSYLGSGKYLKRAIKKYGEENFTIEILEECKNKEDLNQREKYWIQELDSTNVKIGYNIADGGQGGWLGDLVNENRKKSLKKYFEENPNARKGDKNSRYDCTEYKMYNIETKEIFIGTKFDLSKKTKSRSSAINAVVIGNRKSHKKWILYSNIEEYTIEYFKNRKIEAGKYARSCARIAI